MDKNKFVENVKIYCAKRGVKPTIACTESGAGKDLLGIICFILYTQFRKKSITI